MHAIRLALTYLRIGIANELQYRVNFFIQILQSLIALAVGLIGLALVFSHTERPERLDAARAAGGDGRLHPDGRRDPALPSSPTCSA